MKKRINTRKAIWEAVALGTVILGIVLVICNMTKTVPGLDNPINIAITTVIAYGILFGPAFSVTGVFWFFQIRDENDYPGSKRRTR